MWHGSALARTAELLSVPVAAAWERSRARSTTASLRAEWSGRTRRERLRLVAMTTTVAMLVHLTLLASSSRGMEPLARVVPVAVIVVSGLIALVARRLDHMTGRRRR